MLVTCFSLGALIHNVGQMGWMLVIQPSWVSPAPSLSREGSKRPVSGALHCAVSGTAQG